MDHEPGRVDAAIRPNQVLAFSLDHPVLDRTRWEPVLETVKRRLLTPVGLRSLAPGHPDYKAKYYGNLRARDAAYHQGTVWGWLIGPFLDACLASRDLWGPWVEALESETGLGVDYDTSGGLLVAFDEEDEAELERVAAMARELGEKVEEIDLAALRRWVPDLTSEVRRAQADLLDERQGALDACLPRRGGSGHRRTRAPFQARPRRGGAGVWRFGREDLSASGHGRPSVRPRFRGRFPRELAGDESRQALVDPLLVRLVGFPSYLPQPMGLGTQPLAYPSQQLGAGERSSR